MSSEKDIEKEQGKCIIVSAPSGAGKTTIVRYILDQDIGLEFSISATSRHPRLEEIDGHDYYFLSSEQFDTKVMNDEFIEWEEVYPGQCYGTLKTEIQRIWDAGGHVIFDVDVVGGLNLKKHFGDKALAIFIQPPNVKALEDRLRARRSESEETMKLRLDKAAQELARSEEFDVIVINDELFRACDEAEAIIREFIAS
ncbi:MAG: guanylate kinase [Flavobacteriales bacterium]|nr:guanylate kinase [Flavobacteriales bacterium]